MANIFTNNQSRTNNIFSNNQGQNNSNSTRSNVFLNQAGNQPNPFANNNNSNGNNYNNNNGNNNSNYNQGNSIFNQNQNNNSQGSSNIFNNQNSNQNGSIFNRGNNNNNPNIFNNQQGNNNSNTLFGNNNQGNNQNNIFSQNNNNNNNTNNNNNNNIFSQNNQGNNIFQQNNWPSQIFNNPSNFNINESLHTINFNALTPEQQAHLIRTSTTNQIKKCINHHLKNIIEPKRLENLALSSENIFRNEKVTNLKKQILQIKRQVKDRISDPIKGLMSQNQKLAKQSNALVLKLAEKLIKYKENLMQSVTQQKMLKQIKQQFEEIDGQMHDFLKPLHNSYKKNISFSFIDPDPFCVKVSERILKNISYLDNKMDEILASESEASQESLSIAETIENLTQYFENVATSLQQFTIKYNKIKKESLSRKMSNHEAALETISKTASDIVKKQMNGYTLLKQIEEILQKRVNPPPAQ